MVDALAGSGYSLSPSNKLWDSCLPLSNLNSFYFDLFGHGALEVFCCNLLFS